MEIILRSNIQDNPRTNYLLLGFGFLLIIILTLLFSALGDKIASIVLVASLPFILLFLYNFKLTFGLLILTLFVNFHFQWLSSAVWFTAFLPLSFLICFNKIRTEEFNLPISTPLLLYVLVMLLSVFNSIEPFFSIHLMYNMLSFMLIIYVSVSGIRTRKEVLGYIILFLILNVFNSLNVAMEGLSASKRVFGFAGVMFVDYVGIAITLNFILLFISRGKSYRTILIIPLILFVIALLITQTRNAWISTFLSLFLLIVFLIVRAKKFEMRRSFLVVALAASILVIGSLIMIITSVKPEVTERLEQTEKLEESIDQSGQVQSSFILRLMIWHTAYMAFLENPILGIGAYSFPISSHHYYKIPKSFFEDYIEGLTPHVTYIAVAAETGIVGLICFLIFLIASLKFSFDSIKKSKSFEQSGFSLLLYWPLIYIAISMFMTDAWLWGQGIILWGIFVGLNMWNRKKIILENYNAGDDSDLNLLSRSKKTK